jgi:hypothetical protein
VNTALESIFHLRFETLDCSSIKEAALRISFNVTQRLNQKNNVTMVTLTLSVNIALCTGFVGDEVAIVCGWAFREI